MSVVYGPIDTLGRHPAQVHCDVLAEDGSLAGVLAMERGGFSPDGPVVTPPIPAVATRLRYRTPTLANVAFDWYFRRNLPDADALIGWSGMSALTLERANEHGMKTFVIRASPHVLESSRVVNSEYERFGLSRSENNVMEWRECYEYQAADYVVTVSETCRETFVDFGLSRDRVLVVPYDVDVDRFLGVGDEAPSDTFTVCTATSIDLLRGIPYLLEGWDAFADGKDDVRLLLAGERRRDFPDDLYDRFDARDDVEFLGYVDDVSSLYARSDAFALVSLADGGPAGPAEAMAAGLPVIVSDGMGASDDVRDGETGYVVPIKDSDAVANRLERLYADPDLRREMSDAAREDAKRLRGRQAPAFRSFYRDYVAES